MTIKIPLSKKGKKHAGKYVAVVDDVDSDLIEFNWVLQVTHSQELKYARRRLDRKSDYLHRIIMQRVIGRLLENDEFADHADGDGLNCTRDNLRLATHSENMRNQRKPHNNTSGYKGVYWNKPARKWMAQISVRGKRVNLGAYHTIEEAYTAYCEAAVKYHGEFARFE